MANTVLAGKRASLVGSNTGDEILNFTLGKILHRFPGLALQRGAFRTLRIVDLHHRGDSVAQLREIVLPIDRAHFLG